MFQLLSRYIGPYKLLALVGTISKVVEVIFDLLVPIVVAHMIDVGVSTRNMSVILQGGACLAAFALLGFCSTLVCQRMAARVAQGIGTDLRRDTFEHALALSSQDVQAFGSSAVVTRLTSDINQVQLAVALGIRQLMRWPLLAAGALISACLIDLKLGLYFVAAVLVVGLIFFFIMKQAVVLYAKIQKALDAMSTLCVEALSGVRPLRAFRQEETLTRSFETQAALQASTAKRVGALSACLNPATIAIMNVAIVLILWHAERRVSLGTLTQGQTMAFVNYMMQCMLAVVYVANLIVIFTRGAASARRVEEILSQKPSLTLPEKSSAAIVDSAPLLELKHVSFAYRDSAKNALHDISFTLSASKTLGITGGTGAGKSTLVGLIQRSFDAMEGEILLGGAPIQALSAKDIEHMISAVPQKAQLLTGTLRSNMSWRDVRASDEELWRALEVAQAKDFVEQKERGFDTHVEADGKNFSGGQRQRLTIARSLVNLPKLLILDDSASALDVATDARLRAALRTLQQEQQLAIIIISQRISAIMDADEILVLRHGECVGKGTHHELLQTSDVYQEICSSQHMDKEVA